jgi:hypothetical protein
MRSRGLLKGLISKLDPSFFFVTNCTSPSGGPPLSHSEALVAGRPPQSIATAESWERCPAWTKHGSGPRVRLGFRRLDLLAISAVVGNVCLPATGKRCHRPQKATARSYPGESHQARGTGTRLAQSP